MLLWIIISTTSTSKVVEVAASLMAVIHLLYILIVVYGKEELK
jgi:hypothetical protein